MQIDIDSRIVIITGSSTTGKSTLANKILESSPVKAVVISHDAIANEINDKQSERQRSEELYIRLVNKVFAALKNSENKLIIFDVPGINANYIYSLLQIIEMANHYHDNITLIKINLPIETHLKLMKLRMQTDPEVIFYFNDFDEYLQTILSQRSNYEGPWESLYTKYPHCNDCIIDNSEKVSLNFNFPKSYERK